MSTLVRAVLWVLWCGAMAWLWQDGSVGAGMAMAGAALGLAVFAWPASTVRKRRTRELRYVEIR
jgi:membrane associated rhomboid family serine protease